MGLEPENERTSLTLKSFELKLNIKYYFKSNKKIIKLKSYSTLNKKYQHFFKINRIFT